MSTDDEKLPFGIITITSESFEPGGLLDPNGPLVAAVRENTAVAEDAPRERDGEGWAGEIEGFCPVQGTGTVDGLNWYFRARGEAWSFEVWREAFGPYGELPMVDPLWETYADYGEDDFDASWMPFSHAWRFIEESIEAFRQRETPPRSDGDG